MVSHIEDEPSFQHRMRRSVSLGSLEASVNGNVTKVLQGRKCCSMDSVKHDQLWNPFVTEPSSDSNVHVPKHILESYGEAGFVIGKCAGVPSSVEKTVDETTELSDDLLLEEDPTCQQGGTTSVSEDESSSISWESAVADSNTSSLDGSSCSEEDVLNCTFEACNTEGTGQVFVFRIIEYLEDMTGQSCENGQLKLLYNMLDPGKKGIAVDFNTFYTIMKQWIAQCRQDRVAERSQEEDGFIENIYFLQAGKKDAAVSSQLEGYGGEMYKPDLGTADLISNIEDLEQANRKLAEQNAKLQATVEGSEEANAHLSEEISNLKGKLKSSQHALQQARSVAEELEDLKGIVKRLEERKQGLQTHNWQLEKDHQSLSVQLESLQEENCRLRAERECGKRRTEELLTNTAELKNQLYEAQTLACSREVLLLLKINQEEEMKMRVEEYSSIIQELKAEIQRLQEQLNQTYEDPTDGCSEEGTAFSSSPVFAVTALQSLHMEIEQIQRKRDASECLATPLCGTLSALGHADSHVEELLIQMCTDMKSSHYQAVFKELATQFIQETESLMTYIYQISSTGSADERLAKTPLALKQELEEETKAFLEKIDFLTGRTAIWGDCISWLLEELQRLKELYAAGDRNAGCEAVAQTETDREPSHYANKKVVLFSKASESPIPEIEKQRAALELALLPVEKQGVGVRSGNPLYWSQRHSCTHFTRLELVPFFMSSFSSQDLFKAFAIGLSTALLLLLLFTVTVCLLVSLPHFYEGAATSLSTSTIQPYYWAIFKSVLWPPIELRHLGPPPV
ncbi:protein KASH5 [Latimeria chalumnae]|uniref:KASH domain containing 5 n=1 Tax=Latimeria chalumnae TaxID=7897 RepID=M3XKG7_LATCH|nr:PREDICTED: protein KASH5 isoform X2 [Latimeria chalumnae]|eukprot:XP_014344271.1 PREDICTED: protein KASH5 isoform X2 [Latimeria chalumnae]